jgi:hypothetical protein
MSGLLENRGALPDGSEIWVLARGKYAGRTLREVAQDDPGYVTWMYSDVDELTKEQRQAIEEIAEEEGVEL